MKFWDSSAIVPLLGPERDTARRETLLKSDSKVTVWWGTYTECSAALARKTREIGRFDARTAAARNRLNELAQKWTEVPPTLEIRRTADRLLQAHVLRAADAVQLAAALQACGQEPTRLPFVCAGERLAEAARKEGFEVIE